MATEEQTSHVPVEGVEQGVGTTVSVRADGVAAALALDQAGNDPELAAELRRYLQDQRRLADLADVQQQYLRTQMEHLHEQRHLTLTHMRYQHFNDWLNSAWKVLLVILGTGVVLAAGWLVWDARHDKGLVIEAFHVPEDLAAKGYTGTVVAERVLDHLKALQASSAKNATRAANSYTLNWGENLKVEIPETGVSLGELNRYLHERLGHQTHIGGALVHAGDRLLVHLHTGEQSGERIDDAEGDLEAVLERAAERIYATTQPLRHAFALLARNRVTEAQDALRAVVSNPQLSVADRAWASAELAELLTNLGSREHVENYRAARDLALDAIREDPTLFYGYIWAGYAEKLLGHDELAVHHYADANRLLASVRTREDVDSASIENFIFSNGCALGVLSGDMRQGFSICHDFTKTATIGGGSAGPRFFAARFHMLAHDLARVADTVKGFQGSQDALGFLSFASENWNGFATASIPIDMFAERFTKVWLAYAQARQGDFEHAESLIEGTTLDCYPCVRMRGQIAALKKDWPTAGHWFAEAAKQGPSLPFANTEWCEMLLTKGDIDGAIAQCQEAMKRQAHFADPYQYWGEALLLKGDARGAIKQFEQAVKYAPKWGRIQIQWAAALKKIGRDAEAEKKFAAAETLELVPSERALLAAVKT